MNNKEIINYVIPMGCQCFSAFFLKLNNLKLSSYPFDWIFSDPSTIADMLDDNFEKFLNKDNYVFNDESESRNKHTIYLPHLYLFNHRNPIKDIDHDYYVKCINRFYNISERPEKKLFLITLLNNEIKNEVKHIYYLKERLEILSDNFILLCIFQKQTGIQHKEINTYDNLIIIKLDTIGGENGVVFDNEEDTNFYKNTIYELFEFNLNNIDKDV